MAKQDRKWIEDVELEDVQVKWAWSHFDGREDPSGLNQAGDHNFTITLPKETAEILAAEEWAVKEYDGYEEGDPPEYTLKCKISYKYEAPRVFLLKGTRKIRADESDLADIKRSTCERIDVILTPSRWVRPNGETGITAYVKEMYAKVKQSRFSVMYEDYEEV